MDRPGALNEKKIKVIKFLIFLKNYFYFMGRPSVFNKKKLFLLKKQKLPNSLSLH